MLGSLRASAERTAPSSGSAGSDSHPAPVLGLSRLKAIKKNVFSSQLNHFEQAGHVDRRRCMASTQHLLVNLSGQLHLSGSHGRECPYEVHCKLLFILGILSLRLSATGPHLGLLLLWPGSSNWDVCILPALPCPRRGYIIETLSLKHLQVLSML